MAGRPETRETKRHWFDDPRNGDKVFWLILVVSAILFLADAFYEKHPEFAIEKIFGFYALIGFVSSVVLVVLARQWTKLARRGEDFYRADDRRAKGSR